MAHRPHYRAGPLQDWLVVAGLELDGELVLEGCGRLLGE
jgi:hypothetical protein